MPEAASLVGEWSGVLGPGIDVDEAAAEKDAKEEEEDGGNGDAELVRVGVGGAGLGSRNALRDPSKGDLEGSGRLGMMGGEAQRKHGAREVGEQSRGGEREARSKPKLYGMSRRELMPVVVALYGMGCDGVSAARCGMMRRRCFEDVSRMFRRCVNDLSSCSKSVGCRVALYLRKYVVRRW